MPYKRRLVEVQARDELRQEDEPVREWRGTGRRGTREEDREEGQVLPQRTTLATKCTRERTRERRRLREEEESGRPIEDKGGGTRDEDGRGGSGWRWMLTATARAGNNLVPPGQNETITFLTSTLLLASTRMEKGTGHLDQKERTERQKMRVTFEKDGERGPVQKGGRGTLVNDRWDGMGKGRDRVQAKRRARDGVGNDQTG